MDKLPKQTVTVEMHFLHPTSAFSITNREFITMKYCIYCIATF